MQRIISHKYFYPGLLLALFLLQFLFISPIGEFALNDDWVHTDTIAHWTQTGEFRLMPYAGPTFYTPIVYGAGLVKLFGFSFSLLRISTLALTLGLLFAIYGFLLRITKNNTLSFFGALLLWLNPITYSLSFTFMTDVPALLLLTLAMWSYIKGFEQKKPAYIFWGSVLSIFGFYTRQTNILLLGAAGLAALYGWFVSQKTKKASWKFTDLLWSLGVPLFVGGAVYLWLGTQQLLPQSTGSHIIEGAERLLGHMKWWTWYTLMYLGLFMSPFAFSSTIKNPKQWLQKRTWLPTLAIIILATAIRQIWHLQFPYVGNIISLYGLGPMRGVLAGDLQLVAPSWAWGMLTLVGAWSAGWMLTQISNLKFLISKHSFIHVFGLLYFLVVLAFESFDRYLLPLLLVMILCIGSKLDIKKISIPALSITLLIMGIISMSQTKHYLAWNDVRWELANTAHEQVEAEHIDGGYEWNGWHSYWSAHDSDITAGPDTAPWWIQYLFVNNTEEYIVSFSPIPPYDIVEQKKIPGWNPNNALYLLKKPTPLQHTDEETTH